MTVPVEELFVHVGDTIRDVMARIDHGHIGIALLVDDEQRLLGTITDGDIRRAILAHLDPDESVEALLERRGSRPAPLTAPLETTPHDLLQLMNRSDLRHVPVVDEAGRVVRIAALADLVKGYELPSLTAVVMSGGFGTRLGELTQDVPKPMLPVGDRPLLERIVEQLRSAGIHRVNLATHHQADVVARHFGDGSEFGVDIAYVEEEHPLGTAGALTRLRPDEGPLLVMNGDIVTDVDFRAMLDFHREHDADMTVAVQLREIAIAYGVVETDGEVVKGIAEKPRIRHFINAGIYLLNRDVCSLIPEAQRYDMPDLIRTLIERGGHVVSFPVREYWLDIGRHEDYRRALADAESGGV